MYTPKPLKTFINESFPFDSMTDFLLRTYLYTTFMCLYIIHYNYMIQRRRSASLLFAPINYNANYIPQNKRTDIMQQGVFDHVVDCRRLIEGTKPL